MEVNAIQIVNIAGERIKLLSIEDVTHVLNVSERTARQYLVDGLIPSCTIKRRKYVTEQNLVAFLKGAKSTRRKAAVPPPKYEVDDFPPDKWESP